MHRFHAPGAGSRPARRRAGNAFLHRYDVSPGYHDGVFIAEHRSWNRSKKIGYRITTVAISSVEASSDSVFAEGWLRRGKVSGRPVDVLQMPDGALLVSDDAAHVVHRISYRRPRAEIDCGRHMIAK